jgi:hypothetical protein
LESSVFSLLIGVLDLLLEVLIGVLDLLLEVLDGGKKIHIP